MKTIAAWMLTLWIVLVFEHAKPGLFPSGSLMLPFAVGCLFWLQNGTGSLLAGTALITHWILHPAFAPLESMTVLLLSTVLITRTSHRNTWTPTATREHQHAWWLHPLFVLLAGLVCHTILRTGFTVSAAAPELAARLLIAAPCLALVISAARTADEFGLRRQSVG